MSKIVRCGGFVSLTICDIPAELLHEFSEYVVRPFYPSGISVAIKDLMEKALKKETKGKERVSEACDGTSANHIC